MTPSSNTIEDRARQRIRTWIAVTRIKQATLAEKIGKNPAWLSRYLSGEHDAELSTLERIATVFGQSLQALLDVPADVAEVRFIEMFRALPSPSRTTVVRLLEDLTGTPRGGRMPRRRDES